MGKENWNEIGKLAIELYEKLNSIGGPLDCAYDKDSLYIEKESIVLLLALNDFLDTHF